MKFKKLQKSLAVALFMLFLMAGMSSAAVPNGHGIQKLKDPVEDWAFDDWIHFYQSKGDVYHIIFGEDGSTRVGTWLTLSVAVGGTYDSVEDGLADLSWYIGILDFYMEFDGNEIEYSVDGWMWDYPLVLDLGDGTYWVVLIYHYFLPPQSKGDHSFFSQTIEDGYLVFETYFTITFCNRC